MNYKKTSIIYYLSIITLSILFVIISMSVFSQTYVPMTNHHNGISIGIQGTEGADYVFDRYYFDPLINDCGLCYIKSDVDIELSHNDYNSRIHKQYTIIRGGDFGTIRYKVDKDWHNYEHYAKADNLYPAYPGPLSFDDMEYEAGVPVVGTIGINPGYDLTDKSNIYSRGMLDEAGNEYHYFTYYDDDSDGWAINDNGDDVVGTPVDTEESASDGKSMLFCVNPKTPAIWLSAAVSGAEYYTTPAKVWYVPKIHEQTSYVTDNVDIQLKNIMNSNAVYYQIDGSGYQQYTTPISSNTLSDGEHTLEFYYDASYVQSRKIVKNPVHPSKQDVFEDGSGHGYLLWRDEAEFLRFKDRMLNGVWSNGDYYALHYEEYKSRNLTDFSYTGNNGVRNQFASQELMFAMVGVLEGVAQNPEYMEASKIRLMNNPRMHIETIGWETQHSSQSSPSHELTYRGYTDDKLLYANAFTYDLLVKYYRSDQQAGGITPIEDFRLRDMMASTIHETMLFHGSYEKWLNKTDETGVNPSSYDYMWITARAEAAAVTSLTMPAYNTNYYGTAGYDGTQATYNWTPYPDQAESWKDVFITYTDNSNPTHVARLNPFPNRNRLFNWFDGSVDVGLIRDGGDFAHKLGYCSPTNLGHGFEIFYNVMKRKFDMDYPKLYEYMDNSIHNTLWSYYDKAYGGYGRGMMANEYFPVLAPDALVNNIDIDVPGDMKYLYVVQPYYFFFHNPEWESAPTCQSTAPPTVPSNLAGNVNETSINLTWDVSTHSECAVAGYKITRDDAEIVVVQGNNYTDTGLSQGEQYQYAVASVSEAGISSAFCSPIQLTTIADVIPPTIVLVPNTDIPTTMFIEFSESLDQSSAETASNYTIDNGITVSSAQLQPDTKTVRLTVSSLTVDTQYTITINNVSDSDGNVIAANSTAVFSCVAASDNLALNKPVLADSELSSDYAAENAVDGNTTDNASRWVSASSLYPHWIEIDLLQPTTVDKVDFYTGHSSADYLVYDYQIQYWDGAAWIDAVSVTGNTLSDVSHSFTAVSAEKLRLYCTDGQDNIVRLFEIEAYNNSGSAVIVDVDGVSVSPVSLNLNIDGTSDLTETVSPANATNKTVTWESSAPSIATVDQNGVVSAQSVGQATITVTTNDGGFSADCSVTIEQNSNSTPVTAVTVSPQSATIDIGEQVQLTSIVEPFSVESQFVNNLINGMDQHVCVYGTSLSSSTRGNAWMGAVASYFNSNSTYTGQVSYSINGKSGEDSDYGVANIETRIIANSPDAVLIEWAVNDAHVDSDISVEQARSNLIYMIDRIETALPTCEIILQVMNIPIDYRASVRPNLIQYYQMYRDVANERELILVDHYPNWLAILQSDPDLYSQMVPDGIHPTDDAGVQVISPEIIETLESGGESVATDQSVSWSSSNDSIATVDANGLVTAISAGSATITATTTDGGYTADCSVSVTSPVFPVTGVTISQTSLDLSTNGSQVSAVPVFYWDMETENATIYKPGTDSVPFYSISNTQIARTNSVSYEGDWSLNTQGAWSSVTFDNNSNEDAWAPVTEGTVEFYWRYRAPWGDLMLFQMTGKSSTKDPLYDTNDGVGIRTRAGDPGEFYSAPGARNLYDPIDLVDGKWFRFRLRYKSDRGISLQIDDGPQYYSVETSFGPTECLAWHQILIGNDRASDIGQNIDNFAVYDHWLEDDEQTTIPETYQLTATVLPAEATDQTVVWSTSNPDIATVDTTGFVTPVATGTAIITVTTNDGGYTANCIVNVNGGSSVIDVTGVSVSPVDLGLLEGQTSDLTESVVPADATDKSVLWSSSNNSIAIVDTNGVVSAIAEGEAIITVTTNDGGFTATTNVTVGPASSSPANIALNKPVTADSQYSTDYPPEYGVDGNHTDNASRWISASSAYPHWIEIDLQGTYDVSETRFWTGRYSVPYPVHDYQIQYWNGGNWVDALSVTGNVSGAVTNTFATVTTDKIRLYCTAGSDNIVRLFEIEVWGVPASATTTPVSGVSIDPTSLSLTEGETMALTTAISPSDATDQTVTWSTSDTTIAIVDDTGIVTALSAGQATITITTNDGGYTASCALTVNIPVIGVTGVSVAPTVLTLDEGQTSSLTASVTPSNATDLSVSWLSSDASVASVDSSGVVSAIGAGQATIIATTIDGGYTASCALTVNEVITSFDFTETFGTGTAATIAEYTGWDNGSPIVYTGGTTSPGYSKIADTPVSELYDGASGGSNVQIKAGYSGSGWLQIEGINTYGLSDIVLSFGYVYESWSSLSSFTVQVSSDDGSSWTQLTNGTSTGTGGDWNVMTYENIPAAQNLMIKFDMAERKYIYIDDIVISTSSAKGLHLDAKSLFTEKSVKLYPNPVSENYFVLDLEGFDGSVKLNLKIFDVTGKMVYSYNIKSNLSEIPCNLFKGIYFIRIDNDIYSTQKKLIVR